MSGDDTALDFMSEQEVAEILATEELLEVDMDTFDVVFATAISDFDEALFNEQVALGSDTE